MNSLTSWFNVEAHRAYIYRVLTALAVLLSVYGVISDSKVAPLLIFAGVVLGGGNVLASAKTSTKSDLDS